MTRQFLSKRRAPVLFHFWPSCLRFSALRLHDCPHNTLSVHHEHTYIYRTADTRLTCWSKVDFATKTAGKVRLMHFRGCREEFAGSERRPRGFSVTRRIIASEEKKEKILACLLMLPFLWAVSSNCWWHLGLMAERRGGVRRCTCTDTALSSHYFTVCMFYFSSDSVTCSLLVPIYSFETGNHVKKKKNEFWKNCVYTVTPIFCSYIFLLSVNVLCFSQVHIGYLPNKRVLGLSKLAR